MHRSLLSLVNEFFAPARMLDANGRQAVCESMESRCLLSANATLTPDAVRVESAALSDYYVGGLKFAKTQGVRPPSRQLVIDVDSRSATGELSGTLNAAGLGQVKFTGQLDGRRVTLRWTGDSEGYVYGKTNRSGSRLSAKVINISDGTAGKVKGVAMGETSRVLYQAGQTVYGTNTSLVQTSTTTVNGVTVVTYTTTTGNVAPGSISGANKVVNSTGGTGNATYRARLGNPYQDAAGELHFVGVYNGSVTVRNAPEVHGDNRPGPFSAAQTYTATLNITSETTSDLLSGNLTIANMGSYNVTGVVKLDEMTLIVSPNATAANPGGVGVMKLKVSRDGFVYSGRFEHEENSTWSFGTAYFTRPATVTTPPSTGTGNTGNTGNTGGTGGTVNNGGTVNGSTPGSGTVGGGTGVGGTVGGGTAAPGTGTGADSGANIPPTPGSTGTPPGSTPTNPITVPNPDTSGPIGNTPGLDVAGDPTNNTGGAGAPGTDISQPQQPVGTDVGGLPVPGIGTVTDPQQPA